MERQGLLIQEPCKASVGEEGTWLKVLALGTLCAVCGGCGTGTNPSKGEGKGVCCVPVQTWSGPGKAGEWCQLCQSCFPPWEGTRTLGHAAGTVITSPEEQM